MKNLLFTLCGVVVVFCHILSASAASIISNFDNNDDGWTTGGLVTLTYQSSGGNPDGFLLLEEAGGDTFFVIAPEKFLGDLSSFDGGVLAFDSVIFSPSPPATFGDGFGRVTIVGGGTQAQLDLAPNPPEYTWTTYSASLTAAVWGVPQATWQSILLNVTQIRIIQESVVGWETMGFDNFRIVEPEQGIDIEKSTNGEDADKGKGPKIPVGDPVTWTYVVTNTGDVLLTDVQVTDDKLGSIESCPTSTLDPGVSMTCEATGIAESGKYKNTGKVVGKAPDGTEVSDKDSSHYNGVEE